MEKFVGLILAKGTSSRLPGKNKKEFCGKAMFLWNLEKCLNIFEKVYVSSDDPEILHLAWQNGAIVITREEDLCGDVPNIPVYQHALQFMGPVGGIVAVQANSPGVDENLIELTRHLMELGVDEVMTVHPDRKIYGSIWAIKTEKLKACKNFYRPKPNVMLVDHSIDIHTEEDYAKAIEQCQKFSLLPKSDIIIQATFA